MYSYLDDHFQQRKSSLSSLTRTKRQVSRTFESTKTQQNLLNRQQSNQYLKAQQKSITKSNNLNQNNMNSIRGEQRTSSIKKNNPRLRDQQSSDYIRNLYKKYLGKQNKQPVDKLNAFTDRKLRTTESKELINSNTTAKDFTRRTLFPDNQIIQTPNYSQIKKQTIKTQQLLPTSITLMKKQKTKISHVVSKPNQSCQTNYQKQTNIDYSKSISQSITKKDSSKKQEKQNYQKHCESKKSNKNYKSKSKIQKTLPQQQNKTNVIKRSQSTQLKSQKSNAAFESNKKQSKQRGMQVSLSHTQINKYKDTNRLQNMIVHPHRQSYCQFDTQQQIHNNNPNQPNISNKNYQIFIQRRQSTAAENRSSHHLQNQQHQQTSNGNIYTKYINDIETLGIIVGKQSSLYQTLEKINKVKNKQKQINIMNNRGNNMNRKESKLYEQQSPHQQSKFTHRLIL